VTSKRANAPAGKTPADTAPAGKAPAGKARAAAPTSSKSGSPQNPPRNPPRVSAKTVYSATSAPAKPVASKPAMSDTMPAAAPARVEMPAERPDVVRNDQSPPAEAAVVESSRSVVRPTRSAKSSAARPRVDYEKVDLLALALKIADTEPAGRRGTKKNTSRTASNPPAADPGVNRG
jgi:hypothetical protein